MKAVLLVTGVCVRPLTDDPDVLERQSGATPSVVPLATICTCLTKVCSGLSLLGECDETSLHEATP